MAKWFCEGLLYVVEAEAEAAAAAGPLRRLVLLFQRQLGKDLKVTEGVKWRWRPPRSDSIEIWLPKMV